MLVILDLFDIRTDNLSKLNAGWQYLIESQMVDNLFDGTDTSGLADQQNSISSSPSVKDTTPVIVQPCRSMAIEPAGIR